MELQNNETAIQPTQRPSGLTLLCWLSFIGSGISALSNLITGLFLPILKDTLLGDSVYSDLYESLPNMQQMMEEMINIGSGFYFIQAVLYTGSFIGAILMYNRNYKGFHTYTIAQCLLVLWSMYNMGQWGVPWGSIFFSGSFVAMYALYLGYLKNTSSTPPPYNPNDNN